MRITQFKLDNRSLTVLVAILLVLFQLGTGVREDIFPEGTFVHSLSTLIASAGIRHVLFLTLAVTLFVWFLRNDAWANERMFFFLVLLTLSVLVHFREQVYFYGDEWDLIGRFRELGIQGITITHNEHFIPLSFAVYYLETVLFGANYALYVLATALIHALNAYLISRFLRRVFSELDFQSGLANFMALLFVLSALNSEPLHWAFEQSLMLAQLTVMGALIIGWDFLASKRVSKLLLFSALTFISPFFFANGFALIFQLVIVAAFYAFIRLYIKKNVCVAERSQQKKQLALNTIRLTCACFTALLFAGVFYYLNRGTGEGHGVDPQQMFADLPEAIKHMFFGSQLGTILRGIGWYPGLEIGAVRELLGIRGEPLMLPLQELFVSDPDGIVFLIGFFLSLIVLLVLPARNVERRVIALSLWLFGQAFICSTFLLPALGRWQLGYFQSLELRYQYAAFVGLLLMLAPLASPLFRSSLNSGSLLQRGLVSLFFVNMMLASLWQGFHFDYFTSQGVDDLKHVRALKHSNPPTPYTFPPSMRLGENKYIRQVIEYLEK